MLRLGTMAPNARTMGRSPGQREAARRRIRIIADSVRLVSGSVPSLLGMHVGALLSAK